MATALHVQTPEDFSPAAEYSSPWLDRAIAPREEALCLFAMVGRNGDTVESVRELIAVPPRIEAALLLYAERNPEDALGIERVLQFRRRVAEEFERLVMSDCKHIPFAAMRFAKCGCSKQLILGREVEQN
jgi:hypothetical protein